MRTPRHFVTSTTLLVALLAVSCGGNAKEKAATTTVSETTTVPAKPQVQPTAIAGGTQIPGGPLIHVFGPGPDGAKLPVSGFPYSGLEADRTTIGDFDGFSALAYVTGEATGADGTRYLLETDMRVFKGTYRTADGTDRSGVFGFI